MRIELRRRREPGKRRLTIRTGLVLVIVVVGLPCWFVNGAQGALAANAAADPTYTMIPLPLPADAGVTTYHPLRLNDADPPKLTGTYYFYLTPQQARERAAIWTWVKETGTWRVRTLPVSTATTDYNTTAEDINNVGEVSGNACWIYDTQAGSPCHPMGFVWSANGTTLLPPDGCVPNYCEHSVAAGLNERGDVAGEVQNGTNDHPRIWLDAGGTQDLPIPDGGLYGLAADVNNAGDAIGFGALPSEDHSYFRNHAIYWHDGEAHALPEDDGPTGDLWFGTGISDASTPQMVGYATGSGGTRVVRWTSPGTLTELGSFDGCNTNQSPVPAINKAGQVVAGTCLWRAGAFKQIQPMIVNADGWTVSFLTDINARGDIAGFAMKDNVTVPVLLRITASELLDLSVADSAGREGSASVASRALPVGSVTFTIRRSGTGKASTVAYRTVAGTATAGRDYVAVEGTVRFKPEDRVRRVTVRLVRDSRKEPDETFFIRLSSPTGARIVDGTGKATIRDDD
jgi:Calx-beta domain